MKPGPHTAVAMPACWNRPASVPKATSVVSCEPASRCASATAGSPGGARKAGMAQMSSKRKPVAGSTACIAGSSVRA